MPPHPSPLPAAAFPSDQMLYIAENEQDAEILASQFDCQVVVQSRPDQDFNLVLETLKRLDVQTFDLSQTFTTLKRLEHRNI